MSFPADKEHLCPKCGSFVTVGLTCPTFQQGTYNDGSPRMMSCVGCGNGVDFTCSNPDCDWYWEGSLNRKNPRCAENDKKAPPWAEEAKRYEF